MNSGRDSKHQRKHPYLKVTEDGLFVVGLLLQRQEQYQQVPDSNSDKVRSEDLWSIHLGNSMVIQGQPPLHNYTIASPALSGTDTCADVSFAVCLRWQAQAQYATSLSQLSLICCFLTCSILWILQPRQLERGSQLIVMESYSFPMCSS